MAQKLSHLQWVYNRMVNYHDENPNYDYMIKFKEIIDDFEKKSTTRVFRVYNKRTNSYLPKMSTWSDKSVWLRKGWAENAALQYVRCNREKIEDLEIHEFTPSGVHKLSL